MKTEELQVEENASEQKPEDKATEEKKTADDKQTEEKGEHLTSEAVEMHSEFDKKIDEEEDVVEDKKGDEEKGKKDEKTTSDEQSAGKDKGADDTDSGTGEKGIDETLLARAVAVGYDKEQAEKMDSVGVLANTVSMLEAKKADESSSDDTKAEEKKAQEEKEAADKKAEEDAKPFDCGLKTEGDDGYEPEMVDVINKMGQKFTDEINDLKKENTEFKAERVENAKVAETKATEVYTTWLDGQFKATGDDFKDVFGEGSIDKHKEGSDEFKNRAKVDSKIALLVAGYKATKQDLPSREDLFQEALSSVFSEKVTQVAVGSTTGKLKNRAKQTIGKGSSGSAAKTGMEEAIQTQSDFDTKIDEE